MFEALILKSKKSVKGRKISIKIAIIILVIALVGIVIFSANYILKIREYKKSIADISITDVDLNKIPNGSYVGSYDAKLVAAEVRIDIFDHKIKDIDIIYHKNKRGKNAERIVEEIKAAQSLEVDTISGATNSSNVILKAIQNALNSSTKN